jgi:hypothetical protein
LALALSFGDGEAAFPVEGFFEGFREFWFFFGEKGYVSGFFGPVCQRM